MHLYVPSAKQQPLSLGLNVLKAGQRKSEEATNHLLMLLIVDSG